MEIPRLNQKLSESGSKKQEQTNSDVKSTNVYAPGLKSLKIGGETRVRFEANSNFDFDDSNGDGEIVYFVKNKVEF